MKNNYFLGAALIAALTFGAKDASAQDTPLDAVLCNVNADYEDVTDLVPSMFTFAYDGGVGDIGDGGSDMYDGGNRLNTNLATNIPYSDDAIITSTSFGTGGEYFTRHLPGLFVMVADVNSLTNFYITGNNGADGGGSVDDHTFSTSAFGDNYDVFVKRVYGTSDPSINHMMIIPEDAGVSHTWATNTNDDYHDLLGIGSVTRIYYILYASSSGGFIDNSTTESIADAFLNMALPQGAATANASATTLCEGDSLLLWGEGVPSGYAWNLGVTDSVWFVPSVGNYEYVVDDIAGSACVASDTVYVDVFAQPTFTLEVLDELSPGEGSVLLTLTGGAFPFSFDWDNDGTGDFDDPQNLEGVPAGDYTVVVMANGGCIDSASATVNSQVGIGDNLMAFDIYPNPTQNDVVVKLDGQFSYTVMNVVGAKVTEGTAEEKAVIDLTEQPAGTYFLELIQKGVSRTHKIVKQ